MNMFFPFVFQTDTSNYIDVLVEYYYLAHLSTSNAGRYLLHDKEGLHREPFTIWALNTFTTYFIIFDFIKIVF